MPFTAIPKAVKVPARTRHTELVAVLGELDTNAMLRATPGGALQLARYAGGGKFVHQRWAWGASGAVPEKRQGQLIAARDDGTVVTGRDGAYDVWQGGRRRLTIPGSGEGAALFVGGKLVCAEQTSDDDSIAALYRGERDMPTSLRLIDVDRGKTTDLIARARGPGLHVAAAGPGQLAALWGTTLSLYDVETGRKRSAVALKVPAKHRASDLAVSPDGTLAVAPLFFEPDANTCKWVGHHVVEVKTGKVRAKLKDDPAASLTFAASGRLLAASSEKGNVTLWDTKSWKLLERFKLEPGESCALSSWEAHGALVARGERGFAYVFTLNAGPGADTPAAAPPPRAEKPVRDTRKRTRPWSAQSFGFTLGPRGDDQFGGMPRLEAKRWPRCEQCEEPMMFVLSLGAAKGRLPLERHEALMLFMCASGCDTFEPFGGANAALLVEKTARAPKGRPALKERRLRYSAARQAAGGEAPNKVGGAPDWLQGDETPRCTHCKRKLRFVLQLDERLDRRLNFASGFGYLFVCEDEHDARFLWQS